jgi:hypothetical protein
MEIVEVIHLGRVALAFSPPARQDHAEAQLQTITGRKSFLKRKALQVFMVQRVKG